MLQNAMLFQPVSRAEKKTDKSDLMAVMLLDGRYHFLASLDWYDINSLLKVEMTSASEHDRKLRDNIMCFWVHLDELKEHGREKFRDTLFALLHGSKVPSVNLQCPQ